MVSKHQSIFTVYILGAVVIIITLYNNVNAHAIIPFQLIHKQLFASVSLTEILTNQNQTLANIWRLISERVANRYPFTK